MEQGDNPVGTGNTVFRAKKYSLTYEAFENKDLTPTLPIENNPDLTPCSSLKTNDKMIKGISFYPNPVKNSLTITSNFLIDKVEIYDAHGRSIFLKNWNSVKEINFKSFNPGIYFLKVYSNKGTLTKKIIKSGF